MNNMSPNAKVGNYRWRILLFLFFAAALSYIDRQVISILKPTLSSELDISESDYGWITSAFQTAYAIGFLWVGFVVDRFGTKKSYGAGVAFWSLSGILHAFAVSPLGFGIYRFMLGLGEAVNFPAAIKVVAEWFPKKERALATGLFNSGCNMGAVIAPVIVGFVAANYGWRWAFVTVGSLGFIWVAVWSSYFHRPEDTRRLSVAEVEYIHSDEASASVGTSIACSRRDIFVQRRFWGIALARFISDWVWWFFLFWAPDFLHKVYGVDIKSSILPLILIYTLSSFGAIFGGWLSGYMIKNGRSIFFSRCVSMLILALMVLPVMSLSFVGNMWVAVLLISLACFAHQGWASNVFTVVSDIYSARLVATVTAIVGLFGSVGGILASLSVGYILQGTGSYFLIFIIASCAYIVAWMFLFGMQSTKSV
jgi:ACS family hexuronate transporter-like MFS transporter